MYVYIQSEPGLFTVGFYNPDGRFMPESDHDEKEMAAERVAFLNGSNFAYDKHGAENGSPIPRP